MLHKNVDRLSAQSDMRDINVAIAGSSNEARVQLVESLRKSVGLVVEVDEGRAAIVKAKSEFDREGLNALKSIVFA